MERKLEIPKMSEEEIVHWYSTIRPIVEDCESKTRYLRELTPNELINVAYTWLDKPSDYAEEVDFNHLAILEDKLMFLSFGYKGLFRPRVGEVIRQIPKEYLEKVVAFEIINSAIGLDSKYNNELKAGWRACIVRLYEAKK